MAPHTLLRQRPAHGHHRVTYVELLFDLVFVFAITQVSHLLIRDFSLESAAQAVLLLLAVWWVWIFTAWVTNWIDPEQSSVRALLLVLTVVGLVLSAALPLAFESRGLAFAGAYVAMQVGRTAFVVWAARRERSRMARTFGRMLVWLSLSGAAWIAGGIAEGEAQWACWIVALSIEFISPSAGFWVPGFGRSVSKDWSVEGGHMAERCALFVMIALGESVLVTGATFAEIAWTVETIAAFVASLVGSIAMWWLYFATAADAGGERMAQANDPGWLARLAYTYIHILFVAGIVVGAVGDELTLAHPGHADSKTAIAVLGGTAAYLLGNLLFKRAIGRKVGHAHWISIAALGVVAPAASHLTALMLMTISCAVMVAVAIGEERSHALATAGA